MLDQMTATRISAFADELEKIAARKGLKLIRGLMSRGGEAAQAQANRIALSTKRIVRDVSPAQQKAKKMHKRLMKTDPAKAARLEKMMLKGRGAGVDPMAVKTTKSYGALKKTPEGSQIKQLGSGMEGSSTLVASQKGGVHVRKLVDPKGIAGEGMTANRESFGKAMKDSSDVATFRGARTTPGGLREQKFDYVPPAAAKAVPSPAATVKAAPVAPARSTALGQGTSPGAEISTAAGSGRGRVQQGLAQGTAVPAGPGMAPDARQGAQMKRLKQQGDKAGYKVQDLHKDNMFAAQGGGSKAVDLMAVPKKHTKGVPFGNPKALDKFDETHRLAEKGLRSNFQDYIEDPRRAGNLAAQAYGGAKPLAAGSSTAHRASLGMKSARTPPPVPQASTAVRAPAAVPGKAMMPQAKRKAVMSTGVPSMPTRVG